MRQGGLRDGCQGVGASSTAPTALADASAVQADAGSRARSQRLSRGEGPSFGSATGRAAAPAASPAASNEARPRSEVTCRPRLKRPSIAGARTPDDDNDDDDNDDDDNDDDDNDDDDNDDDDNDDDDNDDNDEAEAA